MKPATTPDTRSSGLGLETVQCYI